MASHHKFGMVCYSRFFTSLGMLRNSFLSPSGQKTRVLLGALSVTIGVSSLFLISRAGIKPVIKPMYRILELGVLPGGEGNDPAQVNSLEQVVGANNVGRDTNKGYLWDKGKLTQVASLGGVNCDPNAINDKGYIVGVSDTAKSASRAFIAFNGKTTALSLLSGKRSAARDINNRNEIIGWADVEKYQRHPVLWDKKGIHDLTDVLTEKAEIQSINDRGDILAHLLTRKGIRNVLYSQGKIIEIPTLGRSHNRANGLNNLGEVVGFIETKSDIHAFLYQKKTIDLGTLGGDYSVALSVNDRGEIVGRSSTKADVVHACLWVKGKIFDLNDLIQNKEEWFLESARHIGNSGAIVGDGKHNGKKAAYLLIPL